MCFFFQTEIDYLGHRMNGQGVHALQSPLLAIGDLPTPKNLRELESVLGKLNYYCKFIPNAAHIAAPLHCLRRKNVPFVWTAECDKAFQSLKSALLSDRCLVHYDPSLPLILAANASS